MIDCNGPIRGLHPRNIGVEIFQPESKLITIEPFRPPTKLRPLQAPDDEPQPFHLGTHRSQLCVIIGDLRSKRAHQPMQGIDIDRQRGEIEIHARESNPGRQTTLITIVIMSQSVAANTTFVASSAGNGRPPPAFRRAPVDALNQHRQLLRIQR
jgi:hypothetical protein